MQTWPVTLQDVFDADSFSYQMGDGALRSENQYGPPKVRNVTTKVIDTFDVSIRIDYSQFETLETFYKTTLGNGTLTFGLSHPFKGTSTEFRFTGPPVIRPLGNGGIVFKVSFRIETV